MLAAPPEGRIHAAAQLGRADGHDLGMRQDLDTVMEQITALSSVVHSVLAQLGQQQNAAAPQLRATSEGGQPLMKDSSSARWQGGTAQYFQPAG